MYILGKFGVNVSGRTAVITQLPSCLSFGTVTSKGFPFYGGNIVYKIPVTEPGRYSLTIPDYYGALISVELADKPSGKIVYPPYRLNFTADKPGAIKIKLYGNRANCFGPVHRVTPNGWIGPNAWRTDEDDWSYDYIFKNIGIMSKPELKKYD